MTTTTKTCEGCGRPLNPFDLAGRWSVCMDCTKARHRSATTGGRCKCGRKAREGDLCEVNPGRPTGRKWIPCLRCLGTIKQVN